MPKLTCGFCGKPLPLPPQPDGLLALAGLVQQCRHCEAAFLLASDDANPRAAIAGVLRITGGLLELTASPSIAEVQGQALFLVCAWNPGELLSTVRVAQILELHRATVQQHVREGRFDGAFLGAAITRGNRGYWKIPRGSLLAYLRAKGARLMVGMRPARRSKPTKAR
ncbi:MAG: helix-turn-helix domain-containing protein [Anaerolineales bacterium]